MRKHWVKIVLGLIAVFVLALVAVPFLVNADDFRPTIETQLARALGRPITLGHLSFSLLKGSLDARKHLHRRRSGLQHHAVPRSQIAADRR